MHALLCAALALTLCCAVAGAQDAVFYVSPKGSDQWSGRKVAPAGGDGPFLTLGRAVDAARGAGKPARIVMKGGVYPVTEPVRIGPGDSTVTIEAARGEQPILRGGRAITGWQRDGDRFWSASVPEAVGRKWDFRLLVVNGEARRRARLPETGYLEHETKFDVPWMSTTGGGWKRKPTEEELTTLRYKAGDLGPWLDTNNAELTVYHMWDESVVGIASHDPATRTLRFSNPAGHPAGAFGVQKYVVWNVREGMKRPGQWYLDRTAGKVVYWPLPGEDMAKAVVLAPTVESILRIEGLQSQPVTGVTVRGLSFDLTNTPLKAGGFAAGAFEGAVGLYRTEGCRLENLHVRNVAGQGIAARESARLRVEGCEVSQTGACGLKIDGRELVASDNLVHNVGLLYPSAAGISSGGDGSVIEHNDIHNTPYSAVIGGGENSRYEANLIHHAMQELHDGAGIYVGFSGGMVLRGNVIRDIDDTGGYGSSAYYIDEQGHDCVVENNLALRVNRPLQNHMARNNTIRNNVLILAGDARMAFARCKDYTFEHNVLVGDGAILFQVPEDGIPNIRGNVIFSRKGKILWETLADYAGHGAKPFDRTADNSLADPLFVNEAKGDYRFRPNSPALKAGIQPLDLRTVGPRKRPGR